MVCYITEIFHDMSGRSYLSQEGAKTGLPTANAKTRLTRTNFSSLRRNCLGKVPNRKGKRSYTGGQAGRKRFRGTEGEPTALRCFKLEGPG